MEDSLKNQLLHSSYEFLNEENFITFKGMIFALEKSSQMRTFEGIYGKYI